jgi:predicted ATP-binding protein involved in virulence
MSLPPNQFRSVFLSYSSEDREIAAILASALESQGISVSWDHSIPVGAVWDDFLQAQLANSACVMVLWSRRSVESEWVRVEAEEALRRGLLIPVLIEDVQIPFPFMRVQAASLIGWKETEDVKNHPGFAGLLAAVRHSVEIAPSSADATRVLKESQRSAERRAEELFNYNVRCDSVLDHVEFEKTAFYEKLNWNLTPTINVLLGRNGYGKTFLLRGMATLLQYDDKAAIEILGNGSGLITLVQNGEDRVIQFADHFFDESTAVGKVPIIAIPDIRFVNRAATTLRASSDDTTGAGDRADLSRHGALHFLQERPFEGMIRSFLYGLCLDYFEGGRNFNGELFELVRGVVRELTDEAFAFDRVAREGRDRFTLYVRTEGNEDNPLPIQKASQGTSSVIAMFGLIYEFLSSLRQDSRADVCQRSGIVIIDEIDAHLHPIWQQKIVSLLRNRFPRVQFIITAHNPVVVAGCLEDEVSVLRKNSDHGFSLVQFPNDFVGWQTQEIYQKVFEIENPDETFARYDALRPFKSQLAQQAATLASKKNRNREEDQSLDEIQEKLLYIDKAEQARARRLTQEELERENRSLQDQLRILEARSVPREDLEEWERRQPLRRLITVIGLQLRSRLRFFRRH